MTANSSDKHKCLARPTLSKNTHQSGICAAARSPDGSVSKVFGVALGNHLATASWRRRNMIYTVPSDEGNSRVRIIYRNRATMRLQLA